jgi:peptide/nickel transport system substrate-binding protein
MKTTHTFFSIRVSACFLALAFSVVCLPTKAQTKTLRFVPQSSLTILDPIWSTGYVTRNHAYMIYDTLFSTDSKGGIKPQMVDQWHTSKDGKTWTFKLRPSLEFHDGKPVTSDDVIASLKRWSTRDSLGIILAKFIDRYEVVDDNTWRIHLNEPCGIMLDALGKPSSNVPFIMPARIANTSGFEQIKETIGSGPFIFKSDEFKPNERAVYVKNSSYVPRTEPKDALAGGKRVLIDRIEWMTIRDPLTQYHALTKGEVDWVEQPNFEHASSYRTQTDVVFHELSSAGVQFVLRMNHLHPPFNDVRIRQAAMVALGQFDFLKTQIAVPGLYRFCKSIYPCDSPLVSDETGIYTGTANPVTAAQMLKAAGYDGTPIVLLRSSDPPVVSKIPLVARNQLEAAGFKVDMQQMDWAALTARRAKKEIPEQGGWNVFLTSFVSSDIANPLTSPMLNAQGQAGWLGWQNEPRIEALKHQYARANSLAKKLEIAKQLQLVALDTVSYVPLGMYSRTTAYRKGIKGVEHNAGVHVFWSVSKE